MAFDLGAEAIECDVQRTSDGQLVILHDGTVNRTTDGKGLVAALTFAQVRTLNAGRALGPDAARADARRDPAIGPDGVPGQSTWRSKARLRLRRSGLPKPWRQCSALESPLRERLLVSSFELPSVRLLKQRLPWLRVARALRRTRVEATRYARTCRLRWARKRSTPALT